MAWRPDPAELDKPLTKEYLADRRRVLSMPLRVQRPGRLSASLGAVQDARRRPASRMRDSGIGHCVEAVTVLEAESAG